MYSSRSSVTCCAHTSSLLRRNGIMKKHKYDTYEDVAKHVLNDIAESFGFSRFEGKQRIKGASGTTWEVDAKGCMDCGNQILIVECKRYTKSRIEQSIIASLAYIISDTGANGGIIISPCGLQAGAKIVAKHNNIAEVVLNEDSTTTEYVVKFLNEIRMAHEDRVTCTDEFEITLKDAHGNIKLHEKF